MKENKILLVTGASSDVGLELIKNVNNRYDVILAHYNRTSQQLEQLKLEIGDKLILLQADFCNIDSVRNMIDKIDELGYYPDHVVHLSALNAFNKKFHKNEWEDYNKGIEISLHSIIEILKKVIPVMTKQKYGKIVFMLTSYTLNNPPKYQSSYGTVKYALLGLMKSLSVEYADKGIMVNGVSPDMIETKFLSDIPELIVKQNAEKSPLGRNLTVSDVVPTFEYLLSEAADTITGQNIGVTGGI